MTICRWNWLGRMRAKREAQDPAIATGGPGILNQIESHIRRLTRSICLLAVLVFASPVFAQYQFDKWNTDNGLPQNFVKAILQTSNGYLWLTTSDGLVRFDGVRFTIFQRANSDGLTSTRLTTLVEDHLGNLWIGSEDHGLFKYRDGKFTNYGTTEGVSDYLIRALREDSDNTLWVLTKKGMDQWRDGRFISHDPGMEFKSPGATYADSANLDGFSFVDINGVRVFEGARYRSYPSIERFNSRNVRTLYEDQYGAVWIGAADRNTPLHKLKNGVLTSFQIKGLPNAAISAVCEDRAGNLWIGTTDGKLSQYQNGQLNIFGEAEGLVVKSVTRIYEDREGNIWLGSDEGLFLARKKSVKVLSTKDGLSGKNVYLIHQDREGNVWIGTQGGGLNKYKDGLFEQHTAIEGLAGSVPSALCEDRDGGIWVGAYNTGVRLLKDGAVATYTAREGLASNLILAIHQDREGSIWFGTDHGLSIYRGGVFATFGAEHGLAHPRVQVILEDHTGTLWFGTAGGISRFENGSFTTYTERDGLSSGQVRAIYEDEDGVIWIGTYDGGLNRFKDGKFTRYSTNDGLYSNGVFRILEDGRGNLWMSSNQGIFRVSRQGLNDFAEGRSKTITSVFFDKKDGMLSAECNGGRQPAGWKTRDGRLWFPTQDGVVIINPEDIRDSAEPPKVVIEDYLLDNRLSQAHEPLEISPGQENLQIRYTGLSFVRPQGINFKYKLVGLDDDWVEAGYRRAAYYSHLPPGEYTFMVIAANSDGVWNTEGAAIHVVVRPPFWRTWWFQAMVAICVLGAAVLVYEYRVLLLKKAQAAQVAFSRQLIQSQEQERKRIAAELHDGLGQSLAIIKSRAALGLSQPKDHEKAIEQLDEISTAAVHAMDEVREIAYDLRPYQLDRIGLTKALETMLRKTADSSGIIFKLEIDEIDGVFEKETEINLYRIVQESVGNILKHAEATEAFVAIKRDEGEVEISIKDNGKGFHADTAPLREPGRGGFGLFGIAERVHMMRGQAVIDSAPGAGTTVTVKFNVKNQSG